jgi:hypothetical protein
MTLYKVDSIIIVKTLRLITVNMRYGRHSKTILTLLRPFKTPKISRDRTRPWILYTEDD